MEPVSTADSTADNVRVLIRTRPLNDTEKQRGDSTIVKMHSNSMEVISQNTTGRELIRNFAFDCCVHEAVSQQDVFAQSGIIPLLESALQGYSATVFAYGQTGAGKTFTMSGLEERITSEVQQPLDVDNPYDGIIPRANRYLFQAIAQAPQDTKYSIRASYCEIYNEQVYDLLNAKSKMLNVRWNDRNGFFVQNLLVVRCDSLDDLTAVVAEGHRNRRVDSHALNKDSSRSHSLLTVYVDSENIDTQDGHTLVKFGKISFVDLAGSERLKDSKSANTEETSSINKSLFTLGKVISALGGSTKANGSNFVPYRDSKLTKLLMDSLGGASLTLMIACVSPSSYYMDETLSTLNYATRANNIRNKPIVQIDPKEHLIFSLKQEIQRLRVENQFLKSQVSSGGAAEVHPYNSAEFQQHMSPTPPRSSRPNSGRAPHHLPPFNKPKMLQSPLANHRPLKAQFPTVPSNKEFQVVLNQYEEQVSGLQAENIQLRLNVSHAEQSLRSVMNENDQLRDRLEHLEHVFVNNQSQSSNFGNVEFNVQLKEAECQQLRSIIDKLDNERQSMIQRMDYLEQQQLSTGSIDTNSVNQQLQQRVQHLQQREHDLMKALARNQRMNRQQY